MKDLLTDYEKNRVDEFAKAAIVGILSYGHLTSKQSVERAYEVALLMHEESKRLR